MKCEKIESLLSPYIDGELERQEIIEVEKHIEKCSSCAQLLYDFQSIRDRVKSIDIPAPSEKIGLRVIGYQRRRNYFRRFIFSTSLLVVLGALLIPFINNSPTISIEEEPKQYVIVKEEENPYLDVVYQKEGNYVLTNYEGGSF